MRMPGESFEQQEDEILTEGQPPEEELTDEAGRELMAEAYAVFREAHAEEDGEQLMDVGLWMLDHAQWLAQESDFDVILLVLTRLLLALNQVEDAQWCRTQLDLDLVRADPVLHAELLLLDLTFAHLEGDMAEVRRAASAAAQAVELSGDEDHRVMLRSILAGIAFSATGAGADLRLSAIQDMGASPEARANEQMLLALTRIQQTGGSAGLEAQLESLARELYDLDLLDRAAALLMVAGQSAVQRRDPAATLVFAHAGRQVLCSREETADRPIRGFLDLMYAVSLQDLGRRGPARLVVNRLARASRGGTANVLDAQTHLTLGYFLLEEGESWSALIAASAAREALTAYLDVVPTAGERQPFEPLVAGIALLAVRAAEQLGDPLVLAEVIEQLRMQGLPTVTSAAPATMPVWMMLEGLGLPGVLPRWQTEHEREPVIVRGARPVPRMPWGQSELSGSRPGQHDGQIVDIIVPRWPLGV